MDFKYAIILHVLVPKSGSYSFNENVINILTWLHQLVLDIYLTSSIYHYLVSIMSANIKQLLLTKCKEGRQLSKAMLLIFFSHTHENVTGCITSSQSNNNTMTFNHKYI